MRALGLILAVVVAALLTAKPALSCAFHNYAPTPSLVERLRISPHIVLARPSVEQLFRFADVVALRGSDAADIPYLVDSATRHRLTRSPGDRILFAKDPNIGIWQRLAYVDAQMLVVIRRLVAQLPAWTPERPRERFAFFAALLDHQDRNIHELALTELDSADYGTLRSLTVEVDASRLIARLDWRSEFHLKPIRLLLLGFSDDVEGERLLEAGVRVYTKTSGPLLGAYATALIERGGPASVVRVASTYLTDPTTPPSSRESLVEALAIHNGTAGPGMREAVRTALLAAVEVEPSLAPSIARQFGARYDFSQVEAIENAMEGEATSLMDQLILRRYLGMAKVRVEIEP